MGLTSYVAKLYIIIRDIQTAVGHPNCRGEFKLSWGIQTVVGHSNCRGGVQTAAGRVVLSAPDARESDEVSAKPR